MFKFTEFLLFNFLFVTLVLFTILYIIIDNDKNNYSDIKLFQRSLGIICILIATLLLNNLSNKFLKNDINYIKYVIDCQNKNLKIALIEIFSDVFTINAFHKYYLKELLSFFDLNNVFIFSLLIYVTVQTLWCRYNSIRYKMCYSIYSVFLGIIIFDDSVIYSFSIHFIALFFNFLMNNCKIIEKID